MITNPFTTDNYMKAIDELKAIIAKQADEIERLRKRDEFISILDKQILEKDSEIEILKDQVAGLRFQINYLDDIIESYKAQVAYMKNKMDTIVPAIKRWEQCHIDENGTIHISNITDEIVKDVESIIESK